MLDEVRGEDGADGVKSAQEGGGDAVEAHGGNGSLTAGPLLKAGEVEETCAETCQSTADEEGEDGVAVAGHAAVLCGVLVEAGGLQLIAEPGLFHDDVNCKCQNDGNGNCDGNVLVAVKELVKPHSGDDGLAVNALDMYGVGAGGLLDLAEQVIHGIEGDPVEHDARDNLVNVAVGLENTADGAENGACQHTEKHAGPPGHIQSQSRVEADACAGGVLTGNADVEETDLICKQNGQRAHKQGRGLYKGVAEVFQGNLFAGVVEEVFNKAGDGLARTVGIDEQQNDVAQEQAQNNADDGGNEGLNTVIFQEGVFFFIHQSCPPSLRRPCRGPALQR